MKGAVHSRALDAGDVVPQEKAVLRIDFHIVKVLRGWHVQNKGGTTLATFTKVDDAIRAGTERAAAYVKRGWIVRLSVHYPGRAPEVRNFVPTATALSDPARTVALAKRLA